LTSIYAPSKRKALRPPVESAQYTSINYAQTLNDAGVLGSIGSVGDAYDNAVAESFVDSFTTELIADRVWATRSQLELAVVEYVAWFNKERLHEALGDQPPREIEDLYAAKVGSITPTRSKLGPSKPVSVELRTAH
jgi:putative transposase